MTQTTPSAKAFRQDLRERLEARDRELVQERQKIRKAVAILADRRGPHPKPQARAQTRARTQFPELDNGLRTQSHG
jgi:hypothetical protein